MALYRNIFCPSHDILQAFLRSSAFKFHYCPNLNIFEDCKKAHRRQNPNWTRVKIVRLLKKNWTPTSHKISVLIPVSKEAPVIFLVTIDNGRKMETKPFTQITTGPVTGSLFANDSNLFYQIQYGTWQKRTLRSTLTCQYQYSNHHGLFQAMTSPNNKKNIILDVYIYFWITFDYFWSYACI